MSSKEFDLDLSHRIGQLVASKLGHCATSASLAILEFGSMLPVDAVYVEGVWSYPYGNEEPHAWIETATAIIDPMVSAAPGCAFARRIRIQAFGREQVARNFQDQGDSKLMPILTWDDPRVRHVADHELAGVQCTCPPELRNQIKGK